MEKYDSLNALQIAPEAGGWNQLDPVYKHSTRITNKKQQHTHWIFHGNICPCTIKTSPESYNPPTQTHTQGEAKCISSQPAECFDIEIPGEISSSTIQHNTGKFTIIKSTN